jgi:hypothetical protein
VSLFAAPFRGDGRNALVTVAIEVDATRLVFLERDGTFHERVEVLHSVTDSKGKAQAPLRHELALALKPETYERTQASGIRILVQTSLPAGRYQLRVAAGSLTSGQAGGVLYDLEVPDFTRHGLTMSGVALTSSSAAGAVTVAGTGLTAILPASVTTSRDFTAAETIGVFGEVYENMGNAPAHTVDITTRLRTDTGQVVRSSTDARSSRELQGRGGGYGFSTPVPLAGLDPGLYVIHVEAQSSLGTDPPVGRDVVIRVH